MRRVVVVRPVVVLAVTAIAACGGGSGAGGGRAVGADAACPVAELEQDRADAVDIELTLQETFDPTQLEALASQFNATHPGIRLRLEILQEQTPLEDLIERHEAGDALPTLVQVPADHLALLAGLGITVPMAPCVAADGYDLDPFLPEALVAAQLDGEQWAVPVNVSSRVMVYDRAAFDRAGLDPDRPPRTLAELTTAVAALQQAGFAHPIAWHTIGDVVRASGIEYTGTGAAGLAGPDAARLAEAVARLGAAGALLPDAEADGGPLPPIGAGLAAVQFDTLGGIWGLADALAAGQAPGRELDAAPIPGLDGPGTPVFAPNLLVLGADATPLERAAAWRLVTWLVEPEQAAALHIATDLLPSRPDAAHSDALDAYWDELPLLRRAWEATLAAPKASPGDTLVPTAVFEAHAALIDIAFQGAPPTRLTVDAAAAVDAAADAQRVDPARFLRCIRADRPPACAG